MIGPFKVEAPFSSILMEARLTVTGFMKKATLYVVLNNINNSMTLNNSKNKPYNCSAYEII